MKEKDKSGKKTLDELKKEYSQLKPVTGLLAGITSVLFAMTLYSSIKGRKVDPLFITALALIVIVIINFKK